MNDSHSLRYAPKSRFKKMKNLFFFVLLSIWIVAVHLTSFSSSYCLNGAFYNQQINYNDRERKTKRLNVKTTAMPENNSDGYQSKSKMPEISMKRFRNAIFLSTCHLRCALLFSCIAL